MGHVLTFTFRFVVEIISPGLKRSFEAHLLFMSIPKLYLFDSYFAFSRSLILVAFREHIALHMGHIALIKCN